MTTVTHVSHEPWNKGKLIGQKAPLKVKDIWAIRVRLQLGKRTRELALFNLAIDSKLRGCDLVKLRVRDVSHGDRVAARAIIMQQKTQRSVQFESHLPHVNQFLPGFKKHIAGRTIFCFQVGCIALHIYRHASTHASCTTG